MHKYCHNNFFPRINKTAKEAFLLCWPWNHTASCFWLISDMTLVLISVCVVLESYCCHTHYSSSSSSSSSFLRSIHGPGLRFLFVFCFKYYKTRDRTLFDEWLARRKGLYLHRITQHINTRHKLPCPERDFNPRSQQPSGEDRVATGIEYYHHAWKITSFSRGTNGNLHTFDRFPI
jgi:hypothetical protein